MFGSASLVAPPDKNAVPGTSDASLLRVDAKCVQRDGAAEEDDDDVTELGAGQEVLSPKRSRDEAMLEMAGEDERARFLNFHASYNMPLRPRAKSALGRLERGQESALGKLEVPEELAHVAPLVDDIFFRHIDEELHELPVLQSTGRHTLGELKPGSSTYLVSPRLLPIIGRSQSMDTLSLPTTNTEIVGYLRDRVRQYTRSGRQDSARFKEDNVSYPILRYSPAASFKLIDDWSNKYAASDPVKPLAVKAVSPTSVTAATTTTTTTNAVSQKVDKAHTELSYTRIKLAAHWTSRALDTTMPRVERDKQSPGVLAGTDDKIAEIFRTFFSEYAYKVVGTYFVSVCPTVPHTAELGKKSLFLVGASMYNSLDVDSTELNLSQWEGVLLPAKCDAELYKGSYFAVVLE